MYPDKFDWLVQGRHNSSALAMELCLSCTYLSSCPWCIKSVIYICKYRVNQLIIWANEADKSYYESVCWWMNCMWWALFIYFFNCASMGIFCQKFNTITFMSFQCLWTHLHQFHPLNVLFLMSFQCLSHIHMNVFFNIRSTFCLLSCFRLYLTLSSISHWQPF